ncbi:hypothetical protein [Chryseobacterium profundimaris]|uniref:Sugar-binding protein n=1 Tax=Chryseobacterium profundimaris TaxID=1387275 RepID=A0ABY1PIL5_9FLAO|nr:hypothetical protein [Chryseobacterium profundimaris]SMP33586.1 hypothetical protein SAMN06264346_11641 [Chryseobacterium profundimaris]
MKYLILLLTILCVRISAQNNTIDVFKPIPTLSYLSTYIDTPVDISTGVPKVEVPGFSLPTQNKHININVDMSYHSKNSVRFQKSSDVGLGWSLMNVNNAISRIIIGGTDEYAANHPDMNMEYFHFSDIFYFNAFGMSGKFIFKKMEDNTFTVQNLGTSKEKIEFTNSTEKYFDIINFKITDEYGNQYFFDRVSGALNYQNDYRYREAYYLSKVLDARNEEIVTIEYAEYNYMDEQMPYVEYKPKRIISKGYGEVKLEYEYYPQNRYKSNMTHMSDCYLVKKAELRDAQNRLMQYLDFTYGGMSYYRYLNWSIVTYDTTILDKISRKTSQGNEIGSYSFTYNSTGTEQNYGPTANFGYDVCTSDPEPVREWLDNPKYSTIGMLSTMTLPTKGYVKFNFESNQYYYKRTGVTYDPLTGTTIGYAHDKETQYYKHIASFNFNTKKNNTFSFNVTPGTTNMPDHRSLIFCFQVTQYDPNPLLDPEAIPQLSLFLDNSGLAIGNSPDAYNRLYVPVGYPGQHTVTVSGNTTGKGNFSVYEFTDTDVSNHNYKSKYGARIKSIEYFDSLDSTIPTKSKNYIYKRFSDNETSSGLLSPYFGLTSQLTVMYGDAEIDKNIVYRNVKEIDSDGGYSKYTFIGPDDYGSPASIKYLDDMNTKGLLVSKEMYSSDNQKIASENHEYAFEDLDVDQIKIDTGLNYKSVQPIHVKKHTITNTMFYPQDRSVTSFTETLVNKNDFNVEYTKASNAEGNITETYYDYPYSKQITKLLNKNIYKDLVETKTVLNGKTISKTETKYDNPAHLFPTSVLSYDLQNTASTQLTYDQYDSKGNLQQYTTKDGISTAIIWGYNQTQPIAKIVGATYAQVSGLVETIISTSNLDVSAVPNNDESALLITMDNLRKDPFMANYQITTYTYDPLIGVRSITPPSGIREVYIYDAANRLKEIRENSVTGKLLKEFKYNYKN